MAIGSENATINPGLDDVDLNQVGELAPRAADPTRPSSSQKPIRFCDANRATFSYPAYPDFKDRPQSQVRFDIHTYSAPVMRYYRNSSASCTSWAIGKLSTPGEQFDPTSRSWVPYYYQSESSKVVLTVMCNHLPDLFIAEHPFEAQTISRFFNQLDADTTDPIDCNWIVTNIVNDPNTFNGAADTIINLMKQQLGGHGGRQGQPGYWDRRNRLAAFLTSPNRIKGVLSGGGTPGIGDYNSLLAGDEQLTYLREFGYIFAYWNHDDIWGSWCDSYRGILSVLQQFDSGNGGLGPTPANLASKWATHVRRDLNIIARIGNAYVDNLYNQRKSVGGIWKFWWDAKWYATLYAPLINNKSYIKFDKTCQGLPRS